MELEKDRKNHLLEGQNREKLARYLVENSFYDEKLEQIYFLRSSATLNEIDDDMHASEQENNTNEDEVSS